MALSLIGAAAGVILVRTSSATTKSQARAADPPTISAAPSAPVTSTSRIEKITVGPAGVSVTIDGTPSTVEAGTVAVEGVAGSVHKVQVRLGDRETNVDVILTEKGARPSEILVAQPKALVSMSAPSGPRAAPSTAKESGASSADTKSEGATRPAAGGRRAAGTGEQAKRDDTLRIDSKFE